MPSPGQYRHGKAKQRGAALLIMISIMVLGIITVMISALSLSALNSARQERTSAALLQAKEALIGYAVKDTNRPGELPCPDFNNDGMITLADYSGSNCQSLIGRLPWITLGLPELRDGSGEHLWYALSDPFHANSSAILNSDTPGTLLVYGTDGVSLQTQTGYSAVAVIFSPGSTVGSQTRNTVAQQDSAANYLDSVVVPGPVTRNNADVAGPFIAGAKTDTFNDQLVLITTKDLMPQIEQRVAGEVIKALNSYFFAHNYYPWPDSVPGTSDYHSDSGVNRGWFPDDAATGNTSAWGTSAPPSWFNNNKWYSLIYYSVAQNFTSIPGSCNSPYCNNSTLTVNGTNQIRVLFFMPGTPIPAVIAPASVRSIDNLSHYLEDNENNNNPSSADDKYKTPTAQDKDRDRLYWFNGATWSHT